MVKKLTQHGNSWALVIDRPIMDLIKMDTDTPLEISTDGNRLILSPVRDPVAREKFDKAVKKAHRRYGRMFKKLAE